MILKRLVILLSLYVFYILFINRVFLQPGNASTHTPLIFRYVVFQPLLNEILEGVISQSNRDGLTLTLHFFNDIKVAPDKLPDVSKLFVKKSPFES